MRQGRFLISIVCAPIAAASQKDFDKPSIATEKSFCNSKGVHSRSKQCRRIYICYFCVAKRLVGKSQTLELHPMDVGYAFFAKRFLGLRRSVQPSRNRDDRKNLAVVRTTAPLAEIMKKAPKNFYAIGKFIIAMLLQHYSADAILK